MLSKYGRKAVSGLETRLVHGLLQAGLSPNSVTFIGFGLTVVASLLVMQGYLRWAGGVLFVAGAFDMMDGSMARLTGQSSVFGAFLDSTLDRYSESMFLLALASYYIFTPQAASNGIPQILIFLALVGSLMVSYTRARAEGLRIECKVGILQRPERIVLLIIGLVSGWIVPVLWILALFTNITAFQRILEVYHHTNQQRP